MVDLVGNIAVVVLVAMLVCVVASVVIVRRARRKIFLEVQCCNITVERSVPMVANMIGRTFAVPPREHRLNRFAPISIQYIGNNPRTK